MDGRTSTPVQALAAACGVPADSAAPAAVDASAPTWPDGFGLAPAAGVLDLRRQARQMYWGGFRVAAIARALDVAHDAAQLGKGGRVEQGAAG